MAFESVAEVERRDIPGFPGYGAGIDGTIWSCWKRGRQRKCYLSEEWHRLIATPSGKTGYRMVSLRRDGKSEGRLVHRLVLEAFVGPCPEGMEACHFPVQDRTCNRLDNLRWDTRKANANDREAHGTARRGEQLLNSKLTEKSAQAIRYEYASGVSTRTLAAKHGVAQTNISNVIHGRSWKHVGGPVLSSIQS